MLTEVNRLNHFLTFNTMRFFKRKQNPMKLVWQMTDQLETELRNLEAQEYIDPRTLERIHRMEQQYIEHIQKRFRNSVDSKPFLYYPKRNHERGKLMVNQLNAIVLTGKMPSRKGRFLCDFYKGIGENWIVYQGTAAPVGARLINQVMIELKGTGNGE